MKRKVLFIGLLGAAALAAPVIPALAQYTDTPYIGVEAPPAGAALNRVNERIDQLEQQLRNLTGKIEQNEFTIKLVQTDLEAQLADMQRRLQDIDVRLNSAGTSSAATAEAATVTADATATAVPKAITAPPASETETPVTASGATPAEDPNAALASAPTVKPLGSVSADGKAQPGTPESEYESAYTLLKDKDYTGARAAFAAFLKANPNHDLAGNAQYWLGETYYSQKDYKNAAKSFAEGYQKHRKAPKAADNLLKLGLSLQALDNKEDACVTFLQFKKEYTDASSALKARADEEITKLDCGV